MNRKTLTLPLRQSSASCEALELPNDQTSVRIADYLPRHGSSEFVLISSGDCPSLDYLAFFAQRIRDSRTIGGFALGTPTTKSALFLDRSAFLTMPLIDQVLTADKLVEQLTEQILKLRCFGLVQLAKDSNRLGAHVAREVRENADAEVVVSDDIAAEDIIEQSKLIVECLKKNENARALDLIRLLGEGKEVALELYYAEAIALQRMGRIQEATESLTYLLERRPNHSGAQDLLRVLRP